MIKTVIGVFSNLSLVRPAEGIVSLLETPCHPSLGPLVGGGKPALGGGVRARCPAPHLLLRLGAQEATPHHPARFNVLLTRVTNTSLTLLVTVLVTVLVIYSLKNVVVFKPL